MKCQYNNILLNGLFMVLSIGITYAIFAREITVRSDRKFDQLVIRHNYAVVMFYQSDKKVRKDPTFKRKMDRLENIFKSLSERYKYEEGDLVFLKVNIAKNDLAMVSRDLDVTQVPAFLLFEDGESIKGNIGKPVSLVGFISRDDLGMFIDAHLGEQIEEIVEEKEKIRKQRREEARLQSYSYPYSYPYSYYPYGYYPYGVGFYFGGGRRFHGGGRRFHGGRHAGSRGGGIRRSGMHRGGMRGRRAGGMRRGGMRGGGRRAGGMRGGMRGGGRRR